MESRGRVPEIDRRAQEEKGSDMYSEDSGARGRGRGWKAGFGRAGAALAVLFLVVWAACENPLQVENPNKLTEQNVSSPEAYGALVGAARNNTVRAGMGMLAFMENATDESFWIGSRDAWQSLDKGNVADVTNEFVDATWPYVGQARFVVDKAVILGEQFQNDGTLPDPELLAEAYLYGGTLYTLIADTWQRYIIPTGDGRLDPTAKGSPIPADQMPALYDTAMAWLSKGADLTSNDGLKAELLAMRARAEQAKQIRLQIQGGDPTGNDGVVASPNAAADAEAALGLVDATWSFQLSFDSGLLGIGCESWAPQVWSRGELQVGDQPGTGNAYFYLSNSDKNADSVKIEDPIDSVVDPVVSSAFAAFRAGGRNAPLTEMSGRELHLIVAENALANADTATFAQHINAVRSMDGLTAWDRTFPQIPAAAILEWERNANLIWQGRRLADLYRFGDEDPLWQPGSVAVDAPGTLFPITITEIRSNPNAS